MKGQFTEYLVGQKDPAINLNIHKQWPATPFLVETPLTLPLGTYHAQD